VFYSTNTRVAGSAASQWPCVFLVVLHIDMDDHPPLTQQRSLSVTKMKITGRRAKSLTGLLDN
jgi:hypothetical protein